MLLTVANVGGGSEQSMSFREILTSSRGYLVAAAFALLGIGAVPAHAVPVSVGSTITVSYDRPFFILPDLTATVALTVESITSNQIVLGVVVDNTTSPWFLTSRLSSLSFSTDLSPTGVSDTSSVYNTAFNPANDTIALNSASHRGSLRPTQSDLFTLTLVGNFGSTVDFSYFTAKFQSLIGTYTAEGTVTGATASSGAGAGTGTGTGGNSSVPEPSTISLLAVALFCSLSYRLARQRAARQPVRVKAR
jgi:hypothetical protein